MAESTPAPVDTRASRNINAGRVAAILLVFAGHFGTGIEAFWMLPAVGLFLFAFSSAYFTSAKYHDQLATWPYWRSKLVRLVPDVLLVQGLLLALFLVQGRDHIWQWDSLVHVAALSGFLNWFGVASHSPFGAGMWFLTLLLLFYAVYPLLRLAARSRAALAAAVGLGLVGCAAGQVLAPMGHALWLTASGFLLGVLANRFPLHLRWQTGLVAMVSAVGALALVNLMLKDVPHVSMINYGLLLVLSTEASITLLGLPLPTRPTQWLAAGAPLLIEVYLLHTYLTVHPTGIRALDFLASLALVLAVSLPARAVANLLRRRLRAGGSKAPGPVDRSSA